MSDQDRRYEGPVAIRVVRDISGDPLASTCLAAFYGIEMAQGLGWTTEQRFMHLRQAQMMIAAGVSRMYVADIARGKPVGMMVTTRTSDRKIRRLDAVWVGEPYRRAGIARRLLTEARRGGADFHSYATPAAVAWHLANGFRALGESHEGTVEMFTGDYRPKYSFDRIAPLPTEADRQAIAELTQLERQVGNP